MIILLINLPRRFPRSFQFGCTFNKHIDSHSILNSHVHALISLRKYDFKYSKASTSSLFAATTVTDFKGKLLRICLRSRPILANVTASCNVLNLASARRSNRDSSVLIIIGDDDDDDVIRQQTW